MARILGISSSPRANASHSTEIARVLVQEYVAINPSDQVDWIDLWTYDLPELDATAVDAKYAVLRRSTHSEAEQAVWKRIGDEAEKFKSYDKYLFTVPMWNWGIPFILKKYIDTITQPGLLFEWIPATGYVGLLNKPAVVIYSSSFDYSETSSMMAMDHQKQYFEHWLRVIGCTSIQSIVIAPTSAAIPGAVMARERAMTEARAIARAF
jgi:FMN-dependent NADH-azoreductase